MNDLCYNYEMIKNKETYFPIIDCCYVIIMENSKYEEQVKNQLKRYPLSKNIYLQWNRGFKKCEKVLPEQISTADLTDSYKTVLRNAIRNDYKFIMILEEDFLVNKRVDDKGVRGDIEDFMKKRDPNILLLGSILWSTGDVDGNFVEVNLKSGTHAMIINKRTINNLFFKLENSKDIIDMDLLTNKTREKYAYRIPLIVQVFEYSENQKNWGIGSFKSEEERNKSVPIFIFWLKLLGFSKKDELENAFKLNYNIHFNNIYWICKMISGKVSELLCNKFLI